MAIRNIVFEGDPLLRKTSRPVDRFDGRLHTLLGDMADTLALQNGVGLAAVQVGVLRRVFLIDIGEGPVEFINPQILSESGSQTGREGCLSSPGDWGVVTRPNVVRVRAQNRDGEWFELEGEELLARAMLHENDHLNGRIFKDIAERMLTPEELEEDEDE